MVCHGRAKWNEFSLFSPVRLMEIFGLPHKSPFFHLINCSLLSVLRTSKKAHIKLYRYRLCVNGLKCYSAVLWGEGESFLNAAAV